MATMTAAVRCSVHCCHDAAMPQTAPPMCRPHVVAADLRGRPRVPSRYRPGDRPRRVGSRRRI